MIHSKIKMLSYISISIFLVELHLDVGHENLLIVDLNFLLIKLVDKYRRKIHRKKIE